MKKERTKKKLMWRQINTKLLICNTIIYRTTLLVLQTFFFWILTKDIKFAFASSLVWNIINTIYYFGYHYIFLRKFKIGR